MAVGSLWDPSRDQRGTRGACSFRRTGAHAKRSLCSYTRVVSVISRAQEETRRLIDLALRRIEEINKARGRVQELKAIILQVQCLRPACRLRVSLPFQFRAADTRSYGCSVISLQEYDLVVSRVMERSNELQQTVWTQKEAFIKAVTDMKDNKLSRLQAQDAELTKLIEELNLCAASIHCAASSDG